ADRRLRLFGQPGRFAARRRVDPRRPLHPHARPGPLPHGRGPAAPAALSAPRAGAPASIARGPPMTLPCYEIYALRYATVARRRAENFITPPDPHDGPMPMDYYVWVIRRDARVYLVDTGFNEAAARARGRRFLRCPIEALRQLGIAPDAVRDVIVTHLHYDHAGNIRLLPRARLHLQESELHYACGCNMRFDMLRHAYAVEDVVDVVRGVYDARVDFYHGHDELAAGLQLLH